MNDEKDLLLLFDQVIEHEETDHKKLTEYEIKEQQRLVSLHNLSEENIDEVFDNLFSFHHIARNIEIGSSYTRFRVIGIQGTDTSGHILYNCVCLKCKKESYRRASDILNTIPIFCDLCKEPKIGERYHAWTLLSHEGFDKGHNKIYKCLCDCGNISNVRIARLRNGKSKQCKNCSYKLGREKISFYSISRNIGRKFNSKTITGVSDFRSMDDKVLYNWQCDCGQKGMGSSLYDIKMKTLQCKKCPRLTVGTMIGGWKIIEYLGTQVIHSRNSNNTQQCYLCECECGIQKKISYHQLNKKLTQQCSECFINRKKDYKVGDIFGSRTIISDEKKVDKKRQIIVLTRCICEKEEWICYSSLKRGNSLSCKSCAQKIKVK